MLWHICEEIEHRSSVLAVYNHVAKNRFYRTRNFRKVLRHVDANAKRIAEGFRKQFPEIPEEAFKGALMAIPRSARWRMTFGVLESQLPWHNPHRSRILAYYRNWRAGYESGDDMTALHDLTPLAAAA